MKVLFFASNPKGQAPLEVERELTDLQRRLLQSDRRGHIELKVFPDLEIEELPSIILDQQPDVLHIAAHATTDNALVFAKRSRGEVQLRAEQLRDLLGSMPSRPALVFLNACTTSDYAKALTPVVHFAIGVTAEIVNPGAVSAAATFYEWLARGRTISKAASAANAMLKCIDPSGAELKLYPAEGQDASRKILVDPLRLVAAFEKVERSIGGKKVLENLLPAKDGHFTFAIGLAGCSADMTQVVLFTDDETYISNNQKLERDLCAVSRDTSVRGTVWVDDCWRAFGDVRLFASVATGSGGVSSVSGTLCEALERYYLVENWQPRLRKNARKMILDAIEYLHSNDGTHPTV